ncbi:MAG: hypothetical protein U5J62_01905 [Desulfurivibrio sp.]|nr:hypothetical protein [Desulfurivibrio sp.]
MEDLKVDSGAAEDQDELLTVFIETDLVRRALDRRNPLVLGRKGTGKTALSRRIREQEKADHDVLAVLHLVMTSEVISILVVQP